MGTPEDDAQNTLTARLLLLLESKPLINDNVYNDIIKSVVDSYWKDYDSHKGEFMPAFLANDILRLWRTLCVNYEASTHKDSSEKLLRRKLKNYKLKNSRIMTCYSYLIYLLSVYKLEGTVTPQKAIEMVNLSPIERISEAGNLNKDISLSKDIGKCFEIYNDFLDKTKDGEKELLRKFESEDACRDLRLKASQFGESVFDIISKIGSDNAFYKRIVV